jgi:glyoxylase-like metal-dependent hydrolase (beta-lactamase superfamily II)|eukprot:TRINITY_DN16655_c0_g1_i1.p2 TRINITY_DN16655_c0_g1~~TRINITY_DN16655_c0_g1_i1.p2  ORF type:complete len:342 (+),score=188.44 TRINITY_DN16655_c0_g1_i1:109-1026(+)
MPTAIVKTFFDEARTKTATHVVTCPETQETAIFDPVLHYRPEDGNINVSLSEELLAYARTLKVTWIIDTHVHADHLTSMALLKAEFPGARTGIGASIAEVQKLFGGMFNFEASFKADGSQFDVLFADGDTAKVGNLSFTAMHTPGHTPVCTCFSFPGDLVITGDTIFMPDQGTARCDFPGGSVDAIWTSIQRILALPRETRAFVGHDYAPGGRPFQWETTIGAELDGNIHVKEGTTKEAFVAFRTERDAKLGTPQLLIPSVQVNARGGHLPPAEANGTVYLKIPVNKVGPSAGEIPKPLLFEPHS